MSQEFTSMPNGTFEPSLVQEKGAETFSQLEETGSNKVGRHRVHTCLGGITTTL
jgi:hypothetical protein